MDTHLAKGPTQPLGSGDFSHYHIRAGWASWRPVLSINTSSAQKVLVLGRGGGEGCVVALRFTPPPTSPHTGTSVCGKPSDMGGGQQEEEDPVWSDCQVPGLYKTGCGGSLGSSLNMTSWAVLLIASVLLVTPGEDTPLGIDPGGSSSQPCFLRFDGPEHELQGHLAWVRAAPGQSRAGGPRDPSQGRLPLPGPSCLLGSPQPEVTSLPLTVEGC